MGKNGSKAELSGKLGEAFCLEKWGVEEGDEYEVKSTCDRNNQVILKVIQLIQSLHKTYVAVRYTRMRRTVKRGKRKGRRVPNESIGAAYEKHLDVFCASGVYLLQKIEELKRSLLSTSYENDGAWAPYWTLRIKHFPQDVLFEDERVTVHGDPLDPPAFLREGSEG